MTSRIVIIKKIFLSVGYCPPYGSQWALFS